MHSNSKMIKTDVIVNIMSEYGILKSCYGLDPESSFSRMETDSRKVRENVIFICITGYSIDGHEFAPTVIEQGAGLLITERKLDLDAPQIVVSNSRRAAALLAKLFFGDPTSKFTLIGITGTNGKTTIANLLAQMILKQKKNVGVIGTLGYKINERDFTSNLTTPDIIELNSIFLQMVQAEVEYVIIEVSSHSLYLDRVYGLEFDQAIFTNLTREHLDFHKTMDDYFQAKAILFQLLDPETGTAHINIDDSYGSKLYDEIKYEKYGISFTEGDITISDVTTGTASSSFIFSRESRSVSLNTDFIAHHNILNISLVLSVFLKIFPDVNNNELIELTEALEHVHGRLEAVANNRGISVYVDYAHTPDALDNVLSTLRSLKKGKLITVFGAGGDRDREKRPYMLRSSLKYSDLTIITNDNPRREAPEQIISEIVADSDPMENYYIIRDRKKAIETAIKTASENDIVLIAGKGHESFQYIGDEKIPFYDKKAAEEALTKFSEEIQDEDLALPLDLLQTAVLFKKDPQGLEELYFKQISTDSRTIKPDSLFIALKGENFDGHDYVEECLKTENCWAIVETGYISQSENLIRVENTSQALGDLACKYGSLFPALKIAITGSVGKTTTKEYLFNILSLTAPSLRTFSNENNLIGLPKTIFKLRPEHKFAVLELGSNQFGEIERLSDIGNPDMAVITSIGASHLETFQDEAGVFQEKKALFDRKLKLRFFPGEDKRFSQYFGITFGTTVECDYRITNIVKTDTSTEFLVNEEKYSIPTLYDTFTQNAVIAISVCRELGISYEFLQKGLNKPLSVQNRMEVFQLGERTILADCYNANPQSMKAAIKFWKEFQPEQHHTAVLGDMLELGELAGKLHDNIGEILKSMLEAKIISVGDLAEKFGAERHFRSVEDLNNSTVADELPENTVILIKASHGIELEKFIERMRS
ncbi:UDP-N-acetylmuramoyl-L-alanyl-D-glutamate--2,6-diaminopimelate ligase [Candidatus Cloacimonadota bacterium]